MQGPSLPYSDELHAQKYRGEGEDYREAMNRVSAGLKDDDGHYHELREVLLDMRFMPAGRIQNAIGSTRQTTPYNCYVSGTIEDSFTEGHGSIMERAAQAAMTMRLGGGIGYDFSTLRPRGELIRKLQSRSSGPVAFMDIFDAVCRCVASSGHRRGAQMGVMRIDHPDIEEFVHSKHNQTRLTGFNISIAVTDEFMECMVAGKPFGLRWGGKVYREVDAQALWEKVMRSTWDWAEPGVLFVDTINRRNNLWYCETIAATNPCGEQPLPPYGACLLGSFNLVRYVTGFGTSRGFDWERLQADIPVVHAAMDNVIDRAIYPLSEQRLEATNKRRMGLGITGLSNAAEALGCPYGSPSFLLFEERVLKTLAEHLYASSARRAAVKGSFPLYNAKLYGESHFVQRLSSETRDLIQRHGMRNSHLTSIAPCGTISLCADNVSSGIEPVFAYSFDRTVQEFGGARTEEVQDYGVRVLGVRGKVAAEVTLQEHLDVLSVAANSVDSAVSKTCNVPPSTPWDTFKGLYQQAWERGVKGCTTFNTGGKRAGVLVAKEDNGHRQEAVVLQATGTEGQACRIDATTGRRECD